MIMRVKQGIGGSLIERNDLVTIDHDGERCVVCDVSIPRGAFAAEMSPGSAYACSATCLGELEAVNAMGKSQVDALYDRASALDDEAEDVRDEAEMAATKLEDEANQLRRKALAIQKKIEDTDRVQALAARRRESAGRLIGGE